MHNTPSSDSCLVALPWELGDAGGVNQVVENLILQLQQHQDYRPLLFSCDWACPDKFEGQALNAVSWYNYLLREPSDRLFGWRRNLSFLLHAVKDVVRLARLCRRERIRIINIHHPVRGMVLLALVAQLCRARLVISLHGGDLKSAAAARGFGRWQWSLMFARAQAVVSCSQGLATEFKHAFPRYAAKSRVVHNGVNLDRLPAELQQGCSCYQGSNKLIVAVGTFEAKKGHDLLVQAFANLPTPLSEGYDLVLIGREGAFRPEIEQCITDNGLTAKVFLFADLSHEDVLATLKKAAIFVLPSRQEPFGIVLLEAGWCEVPIIASRVGGIPEVVKDGESGLLFESEHIQALTEKLQHLMLSEPECTRLAAAMRKRVDEFSWQAAYRRYMSLFEAAQQDAIPAIKG